MFRYYVNNPPATTGENFTNFTNFTIFQYYNNTFLFADPQQRTRANTYLVNFLADLSA